MKTKIFFIGLLQAIGVITYCVLIALLFNSLSKASIQEPIGFIGSAMMLVLLVFSAGVTGSIVFGYPAYLFFKQGKVKEPLLILLFTSICCLAILGITAIIYFIIS